MKKEMWSQQWEKLLIINEVNTVATKCFTIPLEDEVSTGDNGLSRNFSLLLAGLAEYSFSISSAKAGSAPPLLILIQLHSILNVATPRLL